MAYVCVARTGCVTIFSTSGILTSFKFTELHALTLAACSCLRASWSFVIIHHHSNEPYSITCEYSCFMFTVYPSRCQPSV